MMEDSCPYIYGSFTSWKPKKMRDMAEFLKEVDAKDPNPMDFVRVCYDQGKVRSSCLGEGGEDLYRDEQEAVDEEKRKYFYDNWDKVIMPLLRYRFPHVANADTFPLKQ